MPDLTNTEKAELKRLAEAATKEPLVRVRYDHGGGRMYQEKRRPEVAGYHSIDRNLVADFYEVDDREYYYAAHPQAVLSLLDENERLRSQLPETMQGCTIRFKQCPKGHGWLTAENWVQHGCPACERDRLAAMVAELSERVAGQSQLLSKGAEK